MTVADQPAPYVSNALALELAHQTERIKSATVIAKALIDGKQAMNRHPAADLKALPGVLASATREMNDAAGGLAARFRNALEKQKTVMAKGHAHADRLERSVAEVEKFNQEMEAVLGDNGDPTPESGEISSGS